MRKFLILIYFIFQVLLSSVNAQSNYPVFVTPTLSPPYSLNLSDYSKFGSQKLMVTIHINDLNISNLPVKLRIKLETTGVTIENPATIATTPIYIDGGSTSILFGNDLTDYFNINNLIFRGYSKETYNRTGQLPEGFYRFSVEVLHFNTNRVISNLGTATAWIALGKPPVLKLPENSAQMGKFKGMPLTFSWLSSNVGSPVSANTIQYKFEMWEMHVPGINPNVVAASMPVFHEHTDFNKMYSLYPINLLMKPGMQYAWRITASDLSGFVPFEQNGHSEIRTFIYKAACDSITNLSSSHRGKNGLFSWNPEDNHTSFNVEMRNPETGWMTNSETYENKAEFFDLDYGATYEMRVQAVCDGDPDSKSDYSTWKSLAIPTPAPPDTADCPDCVCDDDIPAVELQNFDIRNDLQPGDTIINKTGTSRFILKTVEDQGNGVYKGIFLFWAEIWKLKFICNYWDLQVNTDDVIVNMDFESVYDPQFLVDVDATIDYLDSLSSIITTLSTDIEIDDTLSLDETINTIYVNEGDSVIVVTVDDEGNITETVISDNVDDLEEILIEGENGEEYVVTGDGEIMGLDEYTNTGGGNNGAVDDYNEEKEENNLSEDITVNFTANKNQKFGFDEYSDKKINLQGKYPSFNNGYKPAYKSIASFSSDIVGVSNSGSNIIFKDEMGIPALKTGKDISLRGSSNGADIALYAYQVINDTIEKIAGKLNVLSFDEQAKQLYIVPVNGAQTPDATSLQNVLNKTYSQAITRWQVTKLGNLSDIVFEDENMTHGGTSAISVYNNDQKTIVNTFEEKVSKLENNAYYLFFVENVTFKDRSIAGYMPLQRQVGFIYDNPSLNIITHELGHGAFNLWHTFSPDNFIATEHTTQNLMDYKGGTDLWKHQWQLVQSPDKLVFGWLQDESEGEYDNTPINENFTLLFDNVFNNHKKNNSSYLDKISEELRKTDISATLSLTFTNDESSGWSEEEKAFINQWKLRVKDANKDIGDIIKAVQYAGHKEKIGTIQARSKNIYLGKFTYENIEYPIAIYGNGTSTEIKDQLTKVQVYDDDLLEKTYDKKNNENKEFDPSLYIYCDETAVDYMIIGFLEEGKTDPTLIMQIEKFDISKWQYTKEKWLEYLNILVKDDNNCNSGFCCSKCGTDLTITVAKLNEIFPNSDLINANGADYANLFNEALKIGGFNSCERQAKLFAQIGHESAGFNATEEGKLSNGSYASWSISHLLNYFKRTSGAKRHWFNQDFWDKKEFKDFITVNYYEQVDSNATHKSEETKDFYGVYNGENQLNYHVSVPSDFKEDEEGVYLKYTIPSADKDQIRKNIFTYAYGGVLGNDDPLSNEDTEDGWLYRGRGAIQLTGKNNYKKNMEKITEWFNVTYDIVNNPNLVATDRTVIVYSAIAYILQNLSKIEDMDNMTIDQFSALINTGNSNTSITNVNGAPDRESRYNQLITNENLFKCDEE